VVVFVVVLIFGYSMVGYSVLVTVGYLVVIIGVDFSVIVMVFGSIEEKRDFIFGEFLYNNKD